MVLCKYFQQGSCRYGSNCRFEHAYSSKYSYRAPQSLENQNTASSLFRGAVQSNTQFQSNNQSTFGPNRGSVFNRLGTQTLETQNTASSLFRGAVQNNNNQSSCGPNRGSVFNRLGNQTNAFVPNETQKAKSLFAQATQNAFGQTHTQMPNHNPFTSNAKSVFAQANHSAFGDVQIQNVMLQHNNSAASVFHQQNNYTNPVFQSSERPKNVFSIGNNSFDQNICDEYAYSQLEELSQSDIEAFQCAEFRLGCIPELPPPKSLCV